MAFKTLADCDALAELLHGIFTFDLLKLGRSILVKKFVNAQVATSNTDVNLVFVNLYNDTLGSELVNALSLAHEQNFELLAIGVVIDVLGNLFVYLVILDWDVNCNS